MLFDESSLTQFQNDGHIRMGGEADEVMHPSCLMPTLQACGGSAIFGTAAVGQVKDQQQHVLEAENEAS